jgi:hypothetical protein
MAASVCSTACYLTEVSSRYWPLSASIALAIGALPSLAAASDVLISGRVISSHARWARAGRDIVTESVVRTATGEVRVRQLGGTVGGIGMTVSHMPAVLAAGDEVKLRAAAARDLGGRASMVVMAIDELRRAAAPADRVLGGGSFTRTTNATGAKLYWEANCVFLAYATEGTPDLADDAEFQIVDEVFAGWRRETEDCSFLRFELEGRRESEVGLDGVNVVKFRDATWCRPASESDPAECYSHAAAGLTTLYFIDNEASEDNGKIFDADIELNGVDFAISAAGDSLGGDSCKSDLANTLTHEVGHLMGLDHTCWSGIGPQPLDEQGGLVPACNSGVSTSISDATMYAFQDCGETKKASLEADDVEGACAMYPLADDPGECTRPGDVDEEPPTGCCSVAARRNRGGLARPPRPARRRRSAPAPSPPQPVATTGPACSRSRRP